METEHKKTKRKAARQRLKDRKDASWLEVNNGEKLDYNRDG